MSIQSDLIKEIKLFLAKQKMAESRFGRACMGDSKFFYDLLDGKRSPQIRTVERVRAFIKAYKR